MKAINLYQDNLAGLAFKTVDVVATTNQTIGSMTVISGVTITATTRVLLAAQTTASQNGIYVNQVRSVDYPAGIPIDPAVVFDNNTKTFWFIARVAGVVGTDAITVTQQAMGAGVSLCSPCGELNFTGTYNVSLTNSNWVRITPSTTFTSNNSSYATNAFASPQNARLQWVYGLNTKYFYTAMSIGAAINSSNTVIDTSIWVNGVIDSRTINSQMFRNSSDTQIYSVHYVYNLNNNDYLDFYVRRSSGSNTTLTIKNFNYVALACCSY